MIIEQHEEIERRTQVQLEQTDVLARLQNVESVVRELQTEVHELQLAKKRLHPEDD